MTDIIAIMQDAGGYIIWPISVILLVLILLQGGAGDISSAFGGGGQLDSSLGVGAQQKISKVTGWFVAAFLIIVGVMSIPLTGDLNVPAVLLDEADTAAVATPADIDVAPAAEEGTEASVTEAAPAEEATAAPENAEVEVVDEAAAPVEPADAGGEAEVEIVE